MKTIGSILTFTFFTLLSNAQGTFQKIHAVVEKYHKENPELGISVGFIHQNQEYYIAYGNLSRSSDVAINKNSVFDIASITKVITGNLIAQSALQGKLSLDDYMDGYLPKGFELQPQLQQKIKISDLASHQSGLPDIDFKALIDKDRQQPVSSVTLETLIAIVNGTDALLDYGKYRYSTLGYSLLGLVLEYVYGKPYDEIVGEMLLLPLQLSDTYTKDFLVPHKTTGYNPDGGEQEFFAWNITAPAGLLKSNASDLIMYLKHILDTESGTGKAALLAEKAYLSQGPRKIGLGIAIVEDIGQTFYLKSGDSLGQSSMLCYNRDKKWGIVILLNQRNSKLRGDMLNEIYETVLR